ncbi:transport system permease protein [Exiguobacterium sibiricum 255-15]|uniref:Transport system permease protein n=1 Tax=Exiguobacterium sibiricum (strain DSM 17290 / CCUG 55495 / CIP 109462 / JCM 13490 / 255-15) TaxID=262543 RepID=B1YFU2_EXIS2|nr:iron ABC transporter permease [Exiguobacterium sibiricum]ACB60869.1 transport system permease protein [Exiguobacterium sibiricum 255-15]
MIRKTRLIRLLVLLIVLIGLSSYLSLFLGVTTIRPLEAIREWSSGDLSKETLVLTTLRLPRLVLGLILGANLAVAGALMQAVTRNPLASPQVFGVNAGASLFVILALLLFPALGTANLVYFAFFGAMIGGLLVFSFASVRGMTSLKLALVGMAIHLLLTSLTKGLILFNDRITNVLYWLSGSISDSGWLEVRLIVPWSIIGLILAFSLAKSLAIFQLGQDVAVGLGQNITRIRMLAAVAVVLLAGVTVAVAGAIGFIGLMVPHIVRRLVGEDYRYVLPVSALCGGLLLTSADVLARFIAYPYESPVGIVTALLGAPFFLYLAKRQTKGVA